MADSTGTEMLEQEAEATQGADIVAAALGLETKQEDLETKQQDKAPPIILETAIPAPGSPLDDHTARRVIEAVLMVADEPISPRALSDAIGRSPAETELLCDELASDLATEQRGFVIARVAGGYRFQTNPELSSHVEQFLVRGQTGRLSAAALETLAVVAYRQPVSRTQIVAIRGVNVDGVMRTLEQRGLVTEVARDPGPGRAVLYGTTRLFLERLGIDSVEELAPLGQFAPDQETVEALEASLFAASS